MRQLTRSFVRVQYVRGKAAAQVPPLYKVITAHTVRHRGTDMDMLDSGGDSNLREKALNQASIYGLALLQAWVTEIDFNIFLLTQVAA